MKIEVTYKDGTKEVFGKADSWEISEDSHLLQIMDSNSDEQVLAEINIDCVKCVRWVSVLGGYLKGSKRV